MEFKFDIKALLTERIDQILEDFKEEIIDRLYQKLQEERYFTRIEAADYLRVSVASIDNYVKSGLNKLKIGTSTRFKKTDIDYFVNKLNGRV